MSAPDSPQVLQIKKYPNRRYYDTTRSSHVTLQDVYQLVQAGHDVVITDSRNSEDITNLVLLQILLEKDQPKLDIFPSSVFHQMIRSDLSAVRSVVDRYFGPFMSLASIAQRQFDAHLREAMRNDVVSPMAWARRMMSAFNPAAAPSGNGLHPDNGSTGERPAEAEVSHSAEVEELRRQLAMLNARLDDIAADGREHESSSGS